MANVDEDPIEGLLDLEDAFFENQAQGKLVEAEEAKLLIEHRLSAAADNVEVAMRRSDRVSAREALVHWLHVLAGYLSISLSTEHGEQLRQLHLSQNPIGILTLALLDLNRGIVPPIMIAAEVAGDRGGPRAHDLRAVEFKARCVVLADTIGDEQVYNLVRNAAAGYGVEMSSKAQIKEWRRQIRVRPDGAMAKDAEQLRSSLSDLRAEGAEVDIVDLLLAGDQYIRRADKSKVG